MIQISKYLTRHGLYELMIITIKDRTFTLAHKKNIQPNKLDETINQYKLKFETDGTVN